MLLARQTICTDTTRENRDAPLQPRFYLYDVSIIPRGVSLHTFGAEKTKAGSNKLGAGNDEQ